MSPSESSNPTEQMLLDVLADPKESEYLKNAAAAELIRRRADAIDTAEAVKVFEEDENRKLELQRSQLMSRRQHDHELLAGRIFSDVQDSSSHVAPEERWPAAPGLEQ